MNNQSSNLPYDSSSTMIHKKYNKESIINIKPIIDEIGDCLNRCLIKSLKDFENDFQLYKETYYTIITLPIVQKIIEEEKNKLAGKEIQNLKNQIFDLEEKQVTKGCRRFLELLNYEAIYKFYASKACDYITINAYKLNLYN